MLFGTILDWVWDVAHSTDILSEPAPADLHLPIPLNDSTERGSEGAAEGGAYQVKEEEYDEPLNGLGQRLVSHVQAADASHAPSRTCQCSRYLKLLEIGQKG